MSQLAWLTADAQPSAMIALSFSLPADEPWKAQLRGALLPLMYASNFEVFGTLTPDEMADTWRSIILEFFNEVPIVEFPVGSIMPFAGSELPAGWLWCDGSIVSEADYPALYNLIAAIYGPDIGNDFYLPDLRGRFPAGFKATESPFDDLGASGGAKTHTLVTGEMPGHNHGTTHKASSTEASGYGLTLTAGFQNRVRIDTGGSAGDLTTSTGGGGAHNNMPPYLVVNYIIKF